MKVAENIHATLIKTAIKETDEMLTSRASLSIVSHYLDNQSWLIEKLVSCGYFKGNLKGLHPGEQLPCKDFDMNRAYFEIMILAFNLYESFKRDCLDGVMSATSYPEKFRRKFIDTAGRIVKTARRTILTIPKIVMEQLSLTEVWQKATVPA